MTDAASMSTALRRYDHAGDFETVLDLLSDWYQADGHQPTWHRARWAYMHFHPLVADLDLTSIGIATDGDRIVGLVHPEHSAAFAHIQVAPGRDDLIAPLFDWAEEHLGGWSKSLHREALGVWLHRCRPDRTAEAERRGFVRTEHTDPSALLALGHPLEPAPIPVGYRLATLDEDNDLAKVNRVLWRGFDHEGEPPESEIPGRERVQRAPGFRLDRTVVVVAPDGSFASYAGIWLDDQNRSAMVEPVATDPNHRRLGLGTAAVVQALRLARSDGATHAWVGSDQAFYRSMGFDVTCVADLWVRP